MVNISYSPYVTVVVVDGGRWWMSIVVDVEGEQKGTNINHVSIEFSRMENSDKKRMGSFKSR